MEKKKPNLRGMSASEVEDACVEAGEPKYRGRQIFKWIHNRGALTFSEMSDLPKAFREKCENRFDIEALKVDSTRVSPDGTIKYRLATPHGDFVEAVYMPSGRRDTLCISTQVGCAMGCAFCLTGKMKLKRNLDAGEIVDQVRVVAADLKKRLHHAGQSPRPPHRGYITNIVMMGMGEPLHNYDQTARAVSIFTHPDSLGFSTRHVTVSTCGLIPEIARFGKEVTAKLAISLNATTDEVRSEIMPINRKYPLGDLMEALRHYPLKPAWRITFEYVLLAGINDTPLDARRLVRLVSGIPCKVNLIVYNPHPGSKYSAPDPEAVMRFQEILLAKDMSAFVRSSRGQDIDAACGQLGGTGS